MICIFGHMICPMIPAPHIVPGDLSLSSCGGYDIQKSGGTVRNRPSRQVHTLLGVVHPFLTPFVAIASGPLVVGNPRFNRCVCVSVRPFEVRHHVIVRCVLEAAGYFQLLKI